MLLMAPTLLLAATPAAPRDPAEHFFNQTFNDYTEELANAKEQGKKGIMLFFEQADCPFCHYMKERVLSQPQVQAYFRKNFLIFPVDIEGDVEMTNFHGKTMKQKDFAFKVNRVRATPVMAFYDLSGKLVAKYTGKTASIDEFMLLGKYVVDGEYNKMRFSKYKHQHMNR